MEPVYAKWIHFGLTGREVVYQGETIYEMAIIDTEPFGFITDESDDPQPLYNEIDYPHNPERERRLSLETSVRYGLREFSAQCEHFKLKPMKAVADRYLS